MTHRECKTAQEVLARFSWCQQDSDYGHGAISWVHLCRAALTYRFCWYDRSVSWTRASDFSMSFTDMFIYVILVPSLDHTATTVCHSLATFVVAYFEEPACLHSDWDKGILKEASGRSYRKSWVVPWGFLLPTTPMGICHWACIQDHQQYDPVHPAGRSCQQSSCPVFRPNTPRTSSWLSNVI